MLAIYRQHIEHIKDLPDEAGAELIAIFRDEVVKRKMPGGGIAMRFGSNPENGNYGNSILHLHAHLFEPDLKALDNDETWELTFGQSKK